jgi:hypothetical protein
MPIKKVFVFAFVALWSSLGGNVASAQVVEGEEHCVVNVKASDALNVRANGKASSEVLATLR